MNRFFAPGGEFARIERMFGPDLFPADGSALGDDGCVFEPVPGVRWVAASDASVEGTHYRLDWVSPARALRKALLANLSDINAMGGRTRLALLNLGARENWEAEVYDALGAAIRDLESAHGFRVAGGDTTVSGKTSFFSFAVLGEIAGEPLLRSAARPGDRVYVSGSLGGSSAGLSLLRKSGRVDPEGPLTKLHLDPVPPLGLGPALSALGRRVAAIDISDGLSSESWHLARRSGCAIRLDAERLPVHPALEAMSSGEVRGHVLHGGEEYQLLFAGNFSAPELESLRARAPVTEIGVVERGEGVFLREDGATRPLESGGWRHGGNSLV